MTVESATANGYHEAGMYDVVIVGGGAAGIGAAIGARQANATARILLVESEGCLGGAATHRGVVSYCGLFTVEDRPRQAVGKIWDDLKERLLKIGGTCDRPTRHRGIFQVVEPESLKLVLDDFLEENWVDVLLHTAVVGATKTNSSVNMVEIQERGGRRCIYAKAFIDCSGDGDLAYHCGASTRYGNHGYVNLGSLATRFGGLSSAKATATMWRDAIIEAKRNDPSLNDLIKKNSSVLLVLPNSGDIVSFLASASYDARNSSSITKAEILGRRQAQKYLEILRKLPGHENMYLVSSGPNFGTRESRHVNAEYCLTEKDILQNTSFDDVVAIGAWGMEFHQQDHENWESTFKYPPASTFEIPLRCLKSIDTKNLFVAGRCVDGDQYAGSAVRVMGTALATGQAAGVAATLQASLPKGHNLGAEEVQACLKKHGAFIDAASLPDGGSVDNSQRMDGVRDLPVQTNDSKVHT